jgi:hypothetical protein
VTTQLQLIMIIIIIVVVVVVISPPRLGPQWPVVSNPQFWDLNRACPGHPTPYPGPLFFVHDHPPIWFDTGIEFRLFWDYSRFYSGLQQHSSTFFQSHNSQLFDSLHLKMWPKGRPETSERNYHYTLRNNPEEHSSHLLRGGSLKSLLISPLKYFYSTEATKCSINCR